MAATLSPSVEANPARLLPRSPGTYALLLCLEPGGAIKVGRRGYCPFPAGFYVYVGSARGPGGLSARITRHLIRCTARKVESPHWHIDNLLPRALPLAVWLAEGDQRRECAWAQALIGMDGATVPVPGFGSSDCRCPAHLVHFLSPPRWREFVEAAGEAVWEIRLDE